MNNKATLAIYGIKDRYSGKYPAYTHDHNICLMQNGKILQYLQLERYTSRKYDNRLDLFLEELIEKNLLKLPSEFDIVSVNAFLGNAFISENGKIRFEANKSEILSENLEKAYGYYQYENWQGKELMAYNCPQELAHIGSCIPFFGAFKENSLLVHFDGAASVSNFSAFHYKNGKVKLLEYHWDLKYLANFFNDNALSFKIIGASGGEHTSVPGKLMGFASFGKYKEEIENWLKNNDYFFNFWNEDNAIFASVKENFGHSFTSFDKKEPFWQDVAATFQHIFSREFLSKISYLQKQTQSDYLYYAGGCALNIVANSQIIENELFKEVYIPPCCNDSGLSLGAAAWLEWQKGNEIKLHSPYLNSVGLAFSQEKISEEIIMQVADLLLNGAVIGVCNEDAEAGPRALGNRSLIALANNKKLAQKVSEEIKKREWYRPIAPIMLYSVAQKVTENKVLHHLSKFMLLDFVIKEEYRADLQGVTHSNNTARIQTLKQENENPFLFKLLTYLYEKHTILGLINTSFNVQGEPIVHSFEKAKSSAEKMKLDAVIINHKLYKL